MIIIVMCLYPYLTHFSSVPSRWHWSLVSRWSCVGWMLSCGPGVWTGDRLARNWRSAPVLIRYLLQAPKIFHKRNRYRRKIRMQRIDENFETTRVNLNRVTATSGVFRPSSGVKWLQVSLRKEAACSNIRQTRNPAILSQSLNWWLVAN